MEGVWGKTSSPRTNRYNTLLIFVFFDLLVLILWFSVLVYLLAVDPSDVAYNEYRDKHKIFLTHTIVTSRMIYLLAAMRRNEAVRWREVWTLYIFAVAWLLDICMLVVSARFTTQTVRYMWDLQVAIGSLFTISTTAAIIWFSVRLYNDQQRQRTSKDQQ